MELPSIRAVLVAGLLMGLVAASATGTLAVFSDEEEATDNLFQTGA